MTGTLFLIPAVLITAILHFYWNRHYVMNSQSVVATIFMVAYCLMLLLVEREALQFKYAVGWYFRFATVAFVAYMAILFTDEGDITATAIKALGWFGLFISVVITLGVRWYTVSDV